MGVKEARSGRSSNVPQTCIREHRDNGDKSPAQGVSGLRFSPLPQFSPHSHGENERKNVENASWISWFLVSFFLPFSRRGDFINHHYRHNYHHCRSMMKAPIDITEELLTNLYLLVALWSASRECEAPCNVTGRKTGCVVWHYTTLTGDNLMIKALLINTLLSYHNYFQRTRRWLARFSRMFLLLII